MSANLLKYIKLIVPWLVALGLFYYLFQKIPPSQVWQGLKLVNLPIFFAFALFYFLTLMAIDTWGLARVVSQFDTPIRFRELLAPRGVSYLLSILNYNAGQAALAVYLKKTRGSSFFKNLGTIFFVTATDLYWIILLGFVGSFFIDLHVPGIPLKVWVQRIGYIALAALFLHLAFWRGWFDIIIPRKIHARFSDWIRGRHLFQPFHHATMKDYLKVALYRLPLHALIIGSMWFILRLFGVTSNFLNIIATVPIVFLLGSIPLTPGGMGATQVATVELLKNQITSPAILAGTVRPEDLLFAMSLTWMFTNYLLKAVTGLIFLRTTSRDLFEEKTSPDSIPSN